MITRDNILDSVYSRCRISSNTTEQVVKQLLQDLNVTSTTNVDKLIEIIKPYKRTGKGLENIVNQIYDTLNKNSW